jgi:hypothetical protein
MTNQEKKQLVEYIYNFAWQYSRESHIKNEKKLKSNLKEKFILPEEFVERFIQAIEKEKIW